MIIEESVITLRLMQNSYNGCVKCSDGTSTLVAYKLLRKEFKNNIILNKIVEKDNAGVYIMIGTDEDTGRDKVYIGKGMELFTRIKQSHDFDDWAIVILLTTINNSLDASGISFIENYFIKNVEVEKYIVANINETVNGNPNSESIIQLNKFIEQAKRYIQSLGYPLFESQTKNNEKVFNYKNSRNDFDANGKYVLENNHFIVLKGSKINNKEITDGTASYVSKLRYEHTDKYDNFVLIENIEFTSPSLAASFVYGQNANGKSCWKLDNGETLSEYLNNMVE